MYFLLLQWAKKSGHVCKSCRKNYRDLPDFHRHREERHGVKQLVCPYCNYTNEDVEVIINIHCEERHPEKGLILASQVKRIGWAELHKPREPLRPLENEGRRVETAQKPRPDKRKREDDEVRGEDGENQAGQEKEENRRREKKDEGRRPKRSRTTEKPAEKKAEETEAVPERSVERTLEKVGERVAEKKKKAGEASVAREPSIGPEPKVTVEPASSDSSRRAK